MHYNILLYQPPKCEFEDSFAEYMICTSPVEGGVEGTGEEDWIV